MSKSIIAYFSQSGSTAQIAERIAAGLHKRDFEVELHNIKDSKPADVRACDLLGIGMPVYFYSTPNIIMDYVRSLPDLSGIPVFVFLTYGSYRFNAGNYVRRALVNKGARIVGYFHCKGADLFLPYLKQGYLFSPDHPNQKEFSEAEAFGTEVASRVAATEHIAIDTEPQAPPLYRIERLMMNPWLARNIYSRFFKVDKAKCNVCGICQKRCPMSNITLDKDGYPLWGRNCLLCLTCEKDCPRDAITSPSDWPIVRPFFVYNVRSASRDSLIDKVKVTHENGRTRRLTEQSDKNSDMDPKKPSQ